ncbi:small integral membrane protein 5 [Phacochoerus africanus]|uniref:small integral membrane protein 5 n=1 Tax=Phacochoerus africanus TaxID=41426 RepID=UPI001FDA281E|nr:small integral membrane protein 5 [Phacochoerus africanus]
MTAADFVQEIHSVWERLLLKLQRLPQAEPVEIATFSVLVIFAATVVLLLLVAICYCCVQCCCPDRRGRKVQVRPMTPLKGTRR